MLPVNKHVLQQGARAERPIPQGSTDPKTDKILTVYIILIDGHSIRSKRKKNFKMVKTLLVFTELLVAILIFGNIIIIIIIIF